MIGISVGIIKINLSTKTKKYKETILLFLIVHGKVNNVFKLNLPDVFLLDVLLEMWQCWKILHLNRKRSEVAPVLMKHEQSYK